jgi:Zn-dependent peptidase ImmA (M78 family)
MNPSEYQAEAVRQRYRNSLSRILRGEKIEVVERNSWWKELFVADEVHREICLREGLARREKRVLLAHALGHHFLHRGNRFYFAEADPEALETQEREAWEFAAFLLIPTEELAQLAHRPLSALARRFGVPVDVMRLRWALWGGQTPPSDQDKTEDERRRR